MRRGFYGSQQTWPEDSPVDIRRLRGADPLHVQADSLLHEQPRLRHVLAHDRSLDVRPRTLLRWGEHNLPRRRLPRPVLFLWQPQGDPLGVHGFDRAYQDARAVGVRVVDGPRYLLLRRRGPRRREEVTPARDPLRRDPHRHWVVRGTPPLRLRVLRVP